MPLPLRPAPDRPHAWARGEYLPKAQEETTWQIEGFPFYRFDGDRLWHLPGPDASGHRRARRLVQRLTKSGCQGWNLRRNGCAVWVGIKQMKALLRRA